MKRKPSPPPSFPRILTHANFEKALDKLGQMSGDIQES